MGTQNGVHSMMTFSMTLSPGTHNFMVLILMVWCGSWFLRLVIEYVESQYALDATEKERLASNDGIDQDGSSIPQTIVVHLTGMAPMVKRLRHLVQPHVIELLGNTQDLQPTQLPVIPLPLYLSLPPVDEQGGLMTFTNNRISFNVNIECAAAQSSKLICLFGVDRRAVRSMAEQGTDGPGVAMLFDEHEEGLPFLLASSRMVTGPGSHVEVAVSSRCRKNFEFALREKFPLVLFSCSGGNSRHHVIVLDTLGRGGALFEPSDMRTLRLYVTQEYFISSPSILGHWLSRVSFEERPVGDLLYRTSVVPSRPTYSVEMFRRNSSLDMDDAEEIERTVRVAKPMERYGHDDGDPCLVCLDAKRDVTLLPCRHSPVCVECLLEIRKSQCPMCRSPLDGYLRYDQNQEIDPNLQS